MTILTAYLIGSVVMFVFGLAVVAGTDDDREGRKVRRGFSAIDLFYDLCFFLGLLLWLAFRDNQTITFHEQMVFIAIGVSQVLSISGRTIKLLEKVDGL